MGIAVCPREGLIARGLSLVGSRPENHNRSPVRSRRLRFGVRGQSAAATPLWLTQPNPSGTALPSGPMTASAYPGLSRLVPPAGALHPVVDLGDGILTPGGHWQKSQSAVVASLCRRTPHPAHAGLGFGVRGQSAAATPLWLTRPNPSVTALPSGPMTASASPGLARLIPAASALHTYQSCTGAYSS